MYAFKLPDDFLIGTANAAFQSEGAWQADGKSESLMDYYAREFAGKPSPGSASGKKVSGTRALPNSEELPDRGCYFYENYEAYIEDMAKTGQNVYRLSLAWPRIIPNGVGEVNPKGIEFYNKVIDKLLACNITPFVDLYHWDMPQVLVEKGGFANPAFPEWFEAYAKVCFEAFGDRVKMWSTFNEAQISIHNGYCVATFPPFISDRKLALQAGHYNMIAHFRAVRLYKSMNLGGKIGAVNCFPAIMPATTSAEDIDAAERRRDWYFGWWTQVMLEGTYPQKVLRDCPAYLNDMPANYQADLDKWFIPMDFIGVNYYVANRTQYDPESDLKSTPVASFYSAPGQRYAPYPAGLFDVVQYVHERYNGIEIYITENGCAQPNIYDKEKECDDPERVAYLREHIRMCCRCIKAGYNLKGYMYWNDADSYEMLDGYRLRFGLTWVDHVTGERCWKKSRHYFSEICKSKMVN